MGVSDEPSKRPDVDVVPDSGVGSDVNISVDENTISDGHRAEDVAPRVDLGENSDGDVAYAAYALVNHLSILADKKIEASRYWMHLQELKLSVGGVRGGGGGG